MVASESDGRSDGWVEIYLGDVAGRALPQSLRDEINEHEFLGDPESREYQLLSEGKCGVCEGLLEEESIRLSSGRGTIAVTCSVICLDDGMIMGYLNEQMEDLGQRVALRRQGIRESEDKE